jgi:hypothetical protein
MQGLQSLALVSGLALGLGLTACDRERTAEAETAVSEAEVSTELPPAAIPEAQLEATADAAAVVAATPPPNVVLTTPAPAGGMAATPAAPAAGSTETAPAQ